MNIFQTYLKDSFSPLCAAALKIMAQCLLKPKPRKMKTWARFPLNLSVCLTYEMSLHI